MSAKEEEKRVLLSRRGRKPSQSHKNIMLRDSPRSKVSGEGRKRFQPTKLLYNNPKYY